MRLLRTALIAAAALAGPAHAADWWWVAGDSKDDAAVFVDAKTLQRTQSSAAIGIVRIDRSGGRAAETWRGRCDANPADAAGRAVMAFACGTDETRIQSAAILPGLSPDEAARAIFAAGRRRPMFEASRGPAKTT